MILLSALRIETLAGLPFVREKVRAALVIGGVRPAAASQITLSLSQSLRGRIPVEIVLRLEGHPPAVRLDPSDLAGRYHHIQLPEMPSDEDVAGMRQALARLTR